MLSGVGPVTLRKIASAPDFAVQMPLGIAEQQPLVRKALGVPDSWNAAGIAVEEQLEAAQRSGVRILSFLDPEYPKLLSQSGDDPGIIYIKGSLHIFPMKSVAIIGTRHPTDDGMIAAEDITRRFVERGWSIVSGLALGCDVLAHETALTLQGHTVAVLAHGLQTISPRQHRGMADRIVDSGGALISEFPFGKGASKAFFVKRDRTQAALSQGVVMIQSSLGGGSLHAARASLKNDRWLAVPTTTERDRLDAAEQVAANLVLTATEKARAVELLRCGRGDLERLRVLSDSQDIQRLTASEPTGSDDATPYSSRRY